MALSAGNSHPLGWLHDIFSELCTARQLPSLKLVRQPVVLSPDDHAL